MECPNCGLINPDTAERCDCGYTFTKPKTSLMDAGENPPPTYCIKCGAKAKAIAEFCHACGVPVYRGSSSEKTPPYRPTERSTLDWYLEPWKKYGVFTGRARRKEFWVFSLGNLILFVALGFFSEGVPEETIYNVVGLFYLAILVPSLAVGVRRMHDSNHSGWWVIVPLVSWMFWYVDGTRGPNRFGDDPKSIRI